jgi:predicted permease
MTWLRKIWMRLQTLLGRGRMSQRLDSELQFHLDEQIAENMANGLSAKEARYAALRTFGNPTAFHEESRETWGWLRLGDLARSIRLAARGLLRTPGFAIAAVAVMALGIGATTAMFTVVRSVVLKPLPFKDPERLLRLYEYSADRKFPYNYIAGGVFAEWQKQSTSFSSMALFSHAGEGEFIFGDNGELPEEVPSVNCSWTLFSTLGVAPAMGRDFTADDDRAQADGTVILSWGLWKRRFGGAPNIIGRKVHLHSGLHTVIGVMPAWFSYPDLTVQLWTPVHHEISDDDMTDVQSHDFRAVGRLLPGVTAEHATAELSVITERIHAAHPEKPFVSIAANSKPLLEDMVGDVKTPLYVLLAATACLLLIACLNVASLLVARGAARRKELAIRAALGGSRWRLLGEHLMESWLLSAAGAGLGVLMASAVIQWFVSTRQDMNRVEAIHMDAMVLVFAFALVFLCALFGGMTSSTSFRGGQLLTALQETSRAHSAGQGRVRLRKWLLTLEVGLTVVLLVMAGLFLKSYEHLRSTDLGCITDNVLTMQYSLTEGLYNTPEQRATFFQTLLARVRAVPGVEAAGLVRMVPGGGYMGDGGFVITEHPPLPQGTQQYAPIRWADPGYFAAIGIPFLRGHTFDGNQWLDKSDEIIISKAFVDQYFGSEDPIGKHLLAFGKKPLTIVGVVGDTRYTLSKPPAPMMYIPMFTGTVGTATLAVRSEADVTALALPIQRLTQEMNPQIPVFDILTMDQIIGRSTLETRFDATLLLALAVLSLVLAAVGLFGVLSYIVAQRRSEIGIRMALGAQPGDVLWQMLSDGLRPASVGLVLGLAGAAAAARTVQSLLYGVRALDVSAYATVAVLLLCVASVACILPAWRASRVDPVQALRNE